MSSNLSSNGFRNGLFPFFLGFLFVLYVPGFFLSMFFRGYFEDYYRLSEYLYFEFLVTFFLFIFLLYFFLKTYKFIFSRLRRFFLKAYYSNFILDFLLLFFLALSVYFHVNYSFDFRHVSRLSEASFLVTLLWLVKPLLHIILVAAIVHVCNGGGISSLGKFRLWLVFLGMLFSIVSSLQLLVVFISLFLLLNPGIYKLSFFKLGFLRLFFIAIFVPVLAFSVIALGVGSKIGFDKVFTFSFFDVLFEKMTSIIPRVSTSFMSAMTNLQGVVNGNFQYDFLNTIQTVFSGRLSSLLGIDAEPIELMTVNRFNQVYVFQGNPDRAGASPGILSSAFYLGGFPLGLILMAAYFSSIIFLVNRLLHSRSNIGFLAGWSIPFLLLYFLEAPLNLFYVIDPFFFTFIFFVISSLFFRWELFFNDKLIGKW